MTRQDFSDLKSKHVETFPRMSLLCRRVLRVLSPDKRFLNSLNVEFPVPLNTSLRGTLARTLHGQFPKMRDALHFSVNIHSLKYLLNFTSKEKRTGINIISF